MHVLSYELTEDRVLEGENARLRRLLAKAGMGAVGSTAIDNLQNALIGELHHRVKNLLAMVASITAQSIKGAQNLDQAQVSVHSRIMALARSYDAIGQDGSEGGSFSMILQNALAPFDDGQRFIISVPDFGITASAALSISLVFNELCTNAVKYGALSSCAGRVTLTANLTDGGDALLIVWAEAGGPTVTQPTNRSFGMRMIAITIPASQVRFDFEPNGLVCELLVPMASLTESNLTLLQPAQKL